MTAGSIATEEATLLDLYAEETVWAGRFDWLEVWRSRAGPSGPYEPLFADAPTPARVPPSAVGGPSGGAGKTLTLSGLTLALRVGETAGTLVMFTEPGPITLASAAFEISLAGDPFLTSFVLEDGTLVVETLETGPLAILRVVGGAAAPLLGLSTTEPDSVGFGQPTRIPLVPGHSRYAFTDFNGSKGFFYRTRLYNLATHETSEYSTPFHPGPKGGLSPAATVKGTLDLVDAAGAPIANLNVLVTMRFDGRAIEGKTLAGGSVWRATDKKGHVEFMLARGAAITVAVSGTDLARDVIVPTDPEVEEFILFDRLLAQDDLFVVQRPNIPFAARRSL